MAQEAHIQSNDERFGPPPNPRGRRLSAQEEAQLPHIIARPRARYAWAAGIAISAFLEGLKRGKILGRKCVGCDRVLVPPRMFCERCFRPTDEWVELPGTEVSPEELHIGMPVEPVWKPEEERVGSILDIRYFRPRRR